MEIINNKKIDINKQKDNNKWKQSKGITLVALVVTVVILIILARINSI